MSAARFGALGALLLPFHAFAEVSDKIPQVSHVWLAAIAGVSVCALAARVRVSLGWLVLTGGVAAFALLLTDVLAADLRGPIQAEQGYGYFAQLIAAGMLFVCAGAFALRQVGRRRS